MTKAEMIKSVSERVEGVNQKEVGAVLDALVSVVKDVVKADDKVAIPGLGTFSVKEVPERRGKILLGERAGEEYVVDAHKEPKFKMSKNFKNILVD